MTTLLALGPHQFEIIGLNYQSLQRETKAHWASIERFGGYAARQFTGLGPDSTTISGLLFPDELGGWNEYEAIRATQAQGRAVMMVGFGANASGRVFGRVVIESISDTQDHINRRGIGRQMQFSINVAPYIGGPF